MKGLELQAKEFRWILSCLQWRTLESWSRVHYLITEAFQTLTQSRCSKSNQGNGISLLQGKWVHSGLGWNCLSKVGWLSKEQEIHEKPMKESIGRFGRNIENRVILGRVILRLNHFESQLYFLSLVYFNLPLEKKNLFFNRKRLQILLLIPEFTK